MGAIVTYSKMRQPEPLKAQDRKQMNGGKREKNERRKEYFRNVLKLQQIYHQQEKNLIINTGPLTIEEVKVAVIKRKKKAKRLAKHKEKTRVSAEVLKTEDRETSNYLCKTKQTIWFHGEKKPQRNGRLS